MEKADEIVTTTAVTSITKHVLKKLIGMVKMEWCKVSTLRDDIGFMRDELSSMHAFLENLGAAGDYGGGGRHLDAQVREWRETVRRLSADIQACIDDFRRRVDDDGAARGGGNAVAAFVRRNSIGSRIKKLKARIYEINERRRRYNLYQL